MNRKGFTLIELVIILVLIGIIAAYVAPKLGDVTAMKAGAFADKLRADIRYAQNLAMSQNQRVRVTFAANNYDVTIGATHAVDPATGRNYPVTLGAGDYTGISITMPTGFSGNYVEFNSLGVPYDGGGALAANKSVTVTGGQTVLVTAQTGAVN